VVGKPALRAFLKQMIERIPDVRWDEIRHFAHPDQVTVEWLTSGIPRGGAPYKMEGCDILTIRDGKIAAKRSYRKGQV
jgi:ketosteroid isomerase-like protein